MLGHENLYIYQKEEISQIFLLCFVFLVLFSFSLCICECQKGNISNSYKLIEIKTPLQLDGPYGCKIRFKQITFVWCQKKKLYAVDSCLGENTNQEWNYDVMWNIKNFPASVATNFQPHNVFLKNSQQRFLISIILYSRKSIRNKFYTSSFSHVQWRT